MKPTSSRTLWGLFWTLAALQIVDLVTTYEFLAAGKGREGNFFMKSFIHTPIAPVLKALALVFLATLIVASITRGQPAPYRLAVAMWVIFGAYVLIAVNNILILLPL